MRLCSEIPHERGTAVVVGMLPGALIGGLIMGGGWGEGMIFGGIGGAVLGMLFDPRAATYTVPTRGGAKYPGDRDDWRVL